MAFVAFVIASSSTAKAEQQTPSNIPDELPLPYEEWRGTGLGPPTAPPGAHLPPPLARARALPRRPLEVSASLAAFLPSCGAGSLDDRACLTLAPGSGIEAALLYRVTPFFAVGGEGVVSGFAETGDSALTRTGGGARFLGVVGRVYFADEGAWDPYLALTLGGGTLKLQGAPTDAHVSTSGLGGRVAGGIDYLFGSHFRLGPTASFAHWVAWSEQTCSASVCREQRAAYGRLLGFATLGFRLTGSFGDVL